MGTVVGGEVVVVVVEDIWGRSMIVPIMVRLLQALGSVVGRSKGKAWSCLYCGSVQTLRSRALGC